MKKISSVIFLLTFLVFINCKNNAGEASSSDENDQGNKFYQSVIKLGNGFLDVFTSFGGLVADAFGLKADPKKSEVKTYFEGIAKKLEETVTSLEKLLEDSGAAGKAGGAGKADEAGKAGDADKAGSDVESAVSKISELIKEMVTAARVGAAGATGAAGEDIAAVAAAGEAQAAVAANGDSVKGIAKGMKGIVAVAGKLGVELAAAAAAGVANGAAGNLFAGAGATIAQIGNAADAVSKVSGKQILKAIVDSDMDGAGAAPAAATSPIAAAIGAGGNGGTIAHVGNAADAVSKVSGKQILKAIVDSADEAGAGAAPDAAASPIAAAIGAAGEAGAFAAGGIMNRDDNIAAAIVLRGMAASGKFAHGADDGGNAGIKN
ncbi:variable large family protein [Borreliella lusitaniae]|uniref:variable large family protein n=1 Tax=Borreliella lusitaniae TaxID=100177 RepID=UPI003C711AFF